MSAVSKRELLAYQADVKGSIFRQIRERFARLKQSGFTQKEWAARIDMDEGHLSRRVRGDYDLQLETLSDLARGLECRINVQLMPLAEAAVAQRNYVSPKSARLRFECPERNEESPKTTKSWDEADDLEVAA
jgi:hypothetical protein